MKKMITLLVMASLLFSGCSQKELTKEEALQLIKKEFNYPRVVDHDVFCADPKHARIFLDKEIESSGYVMVDRTQKLKDAGKPLIHFTASAKPYLLPVSEKDRQMEVQKVKIADEDIGEITAVIPDKSNNTATVEYNTVYRNITPFSVLLKKDLKQPDKKTAYFALSDKGWVIQKKQ